MSTYKPKYCYDDRDRNIMPTYNDHKVNYLSEDCDLSQKIKNLEIEGLKLRSQVENILHETNEESTTRTCESMNECDSISMDPNEIYDQHFIKDQTPRFNQKSFDCKSSKDYNHKDSKGLQKELEEYHGKIEFMQQKLKQDNYAHQMEKEELIMSIENLKRSNFKLKSMSDSQMQDLKNRERKLESMIECLKTSLNQVLNVNKKQEDLLTESSKRLLELESVPVTLKAFNNLRDLLIDVEYHQGSKFMADKDLENCSPNALVDIVDKHIKELHLELEDRTRKIRQLEDDIVQVKRNLLHDKEKSMLEIKNQLAFLEEQNSYMKHNVREINDNADREIGKLREENMMLKSKLESEMNGATSVIDGLETNLQQLSNKLKRENDNWLLEKKSMEKLIDESEKQMAVVRVERDQAFNQKSSILAKLDAVQSKLCETETQLLQLQSEKYGQEKQIEGLNKRNKAIENSLSYTRVYLENITKSIRLSSFRGDGVDSNEANSSNLLLDLDLSDEDNIPWRPRKYEIEEILQQIQIMTQQKTEAIEKWEQMKKEFEILEKNYDSVKLEKKRLEQIIKAKQLEIESSKNENSHINSVMANRNGEIERLTAERDYYFQMLNEKTEDLATVKAEKHRISSLLEERCRQLELQNKTTPNSNQNNEIIDTSRAKNQIIREERNRLAIQLQDIQNARDELLSSQKDQSVCIEHFRKENVHLQSELKNLYKDYDQVLMENKKLLIKLKDSDSEIANLCQERQHVKSSKSKKNLSLEKRIADLITEVASYKGELKIANDRIRELEKSGSKSAHNALSPAVLNEMSKPMPDIDPLQVTKSRLSSLEKQMSSVQASHETVKDENIKLTELLRKITIQNDRMAEELENYVEENKRLREKIHNKPTEESGRKDKMVKDQNKMKYSDKRNESYQSNGKIRNMDPIKTDSILQLREDLQESIKEAKKLLKSKPHQSNQQNKIKNYDISTDSSDNTISKDNNYGSRKKNVNESSLNTKRSESTSLTEVDRHLNIPQTKRKDASTKPFKNSSSPVEKLFSSDIQNDIKKSYQKRPDRQGHELEEKIKRLLTTEN